MCKVKEHLRGARVKCVLKIAAHNFRCCLRIKARNRSFYVCVRFQYHHFTKQHQKPKKKKTNHFHARLSEKKRVCAIVCALSRLTAQMLHSIYFVRYPLTAPIKNGKAQKLSNTVQRSKKKNRRRTKQIRATK